MGRILSAEFIETALVVIGLFVLYSFFVLASIAILRSRTKRVREFTRRGIAGAKLARIILIRSNSYLLVCQTGQFISALTAGVILTHIIRSELFAQLVTSILPSQHAYHSELYFGLSVLAIAAVASVALLCVQISKALAFNSPERVLCFSAFIIIFCSRVLRPIVVVLSLIGNAVLKAAGLHLPAEKEMVISAQDINEMLELSNEAGGIEDEEKELIQGVFAFSEKKVQDVMTPRKDIIYVNEDADLDTVVSLFAAERISRLLVVGNDLDDVKGILISKDLTPFVGKPFEDFDLKNFIRPGYFVPNSKFIGELLEELRTNAQHFAVVMDEHGGVDGVVTVEDLLEEIVGEIFDEYDSPVDEGKTVVRTRSGDLLVSGSMPIDELNENFNFAFPRGEYNTIAGFVIHTLGSMPEVGAMIEHNGLRLRVERLDSNRIALLRIIAPKKTKEIKNLSPATALPAARDALSSQPVASSPKARISGSR